MKNRLFILGRMKKFIFLLFISVPLCCGAQSKIEMQKEISIPTGQSACFPRPEECQLKKDYPDPIQGTFYVWKIKKHRKYIAVYASMSEQNYKIVGDRNSPLRTLSRHHYYNLQIQSLFSYPSDHLITSIALYDTYISVEPKNKIYEIHKLIEIVP